MAVLKYNYQHKEDNFKSISFSSKRDNKTVKGLMTRIFNLHNDFGDYQILEVVKTKKVYHRIVAQRVKNGEIVELATFEAEYDN